MSLVLLIILLYNRDKNSHATSQTMDTNFTWPTTERGEKAILYNNFVGMRVRVAEKLYRYIKRC